MQTTSTTSISNIRLIDSYTSGATSGAVAAVQEVTSPSSESTTVRLSNEARTQYATVQNRSSEEESDSPIKQAINSVESQESNSADATTAINETLEQLQKALEEAQKRLDIAVQQMNKAMMEMKNASDESERMAAMIKVQTAQMQVISAQGEVLAIYTQMNELLEAQKNARTPINFGA